MGLKECQIFYDNQWGTYYGGQTVSGHVELVLDSPKNVRAVTIEFKGEARTSWTESHDETDSKGDRQTVNVSYGASEEYFKLRWPLIGAEGSSQIVLPAGRQVFPFTCALPPTLPSSFEGEDGYIRYTCKVTLDRPWKFDQETKAALTVLSNVDLNMVERCRAPSAITADKFFCCCWCKSGPLSCTMSVPCTGYVPGQTVAVNIDVDNASNVEVYSVHVFINKTVTFYSSIRSDTRVSRDTVVDQKFGGVAAHGNGNFNAQLKLPALPPSGLATCSIIDLDYSLHVEVKVSGMHSNVTGRIPLVIGTVPLNQVPTLAAPSAPMDSTSVTTPLMGWNPQNMNVLPTYEHSQFGTTSIKDPSDSDYTMFSGGGAAFSPNYPVFYPQQNAAH